MGMYDTYNDIQLKVGQCVMSCYRTGDKVDINDGVYLAPDGVVVIVGGKLAATFEKMTDKWGEDIDVEMMMKERNPVYLTVKAFEDKILDGALLVNKKEIPPQ